MVNELNEFLKRKFKENVFLNKNTKYYIYKHVFSLCESSLLGKLIVTIVSLLKHF